MSKKEEKCQGREKNKTLPKEKNKCPFIFILDSLDIRNY